MIGQKHTLFPEFIKMSEGEEEQYVKEAGKKNPKELSYRDWFWFHDSAYTLLNYGMPILIMVFFFGISGVFIFYQHFISASLVGLIGLAGVVDLYRKLKNPKIEGTTFYYMWMVPAADKILDNIVIEDDK
jgi:hypothetical protein